MSVQLELEAVAEAGLVPGFADHQRCGAAHETLHAQTLLPAKETPDRFCRDVVSHALMLDVRWDTSQYQRCAEGLMDEDRVEPVFIERTPQQIRKLAQWSALWSVRQLRICTYSAVAKMQGMDSFAALRALEDLVADGRVGKRRTAQGRPVYFDIRLTQRDPA